MTHICISKQTIIGSDIGLSPGRHQAIIWTNVGILLIGPLGTKFNEILIEIHAFSFKEMHLKMSSGKWRPSCLGPNVLSCYSRKGFTMENWGPFHERVFHCISNMMEIWFCSHRSCSQVMARNFCTWHDSYAVVACAKFCSDMIPYNGVTLKPIFHWIWIRSKICSWNRPQCSDDETWLKLTCNSRPNLKYLKRKFKIRTPSGYINH